MSSRLQIFETNFHVLIYLLKVNSAAIVGLLCGLRGKPHRELAEWTRAPAAFLEMSELPRTCLPIEDIEEISETQKERQKHDDEAMVLFSQ